MVLKPTLNIWTYDVDEPIHSHSYVSSVTQPLILNTYDTNFFNVWWLDKFEDIIIHWKSKDEKCFTSVKEMLANKCPYVFDKEIRPTHNLQRIFWGTIYNYYGDNK